MMDMIEERFLKSLPGDFSSVEHALIVAGSALQYLAGQCEVKEEDGPEADATD
jgi:hypothetical protein